MQGLGYGTYLAALAILGTGTLLAQEVVVRIGAMVWAVSLLTLVANLGMILSHWLRPRVARANKTDALPVAVPAHLS
jgi:hypothetical protein